MPGSSCPLTFLPSRPRQAGKRLESEEEKARLLAFYVNVLLTIAV
jgi:hypothetical protein